EVEERWERTVGQICHDLETAVVEHPQERVAIEEHSMLWRLQPRPSVTEQPERHTVESRHFDNQTSLRCEQVASGTQRSRRVVIVLEKVPHGDQIEPIVTEVLLVEQTTPEV